MSPRIVFNGREYDDLASMPPDVRRQYDAVLAQLGPAERAKLEAAGGGSSVKVNVKVERTFKINGTEYASPDEMPADVRAIYERALAATPSLRDTQASGVTPSPRGMPELPPAIDEEDDGRSRLLRAALIAAVVAGLVVWWLAHH